MATFYRCDKCGNETENKARLYRVDVPESPGISAATKKELCHHCIGRLRSWLEPDALEAMPRK